MTDLTDCPFDENPFTHHQHPQAEKMQDMPVNSEFDNKLVQKMIFLMTKNM